MSPDTIYVLLATGFWTSLFVLACVSPTGRRRK